MMPHRLPLRAKARHWRGHLIMIKISTLTERQHLTSVSCEIEARCQRARLAWALPGLDLSCARAVHALCQASQSIPKRPVTTQSISSARHCRTKRCLYVCIHCPEREQCLTYSIKHEVLEQFCGTWYDWIYKINDNYARNRNWSVKHKNIFRERPPNTRQLRTDWTSR